MRVYLHSTRCEALTVGETTLTRWSLANDSPTQLLEISTAPHPLLDFLILQDGRMAFFGGVTHAPDGEVFALDSTHPQKQRYTDPCVIEVRHWEDLSLATTITLPQACEPLWSLAGSPDGRWLVTATGNPERLFLLDWHTGKVMSHHALWGGVTTGLTFDPTSTFVAGVSGHESWGHLMLWRLVPAKDWSPHMEGRPPELAQQPDEIHGPYAFNPDHWAFDRTETAWPRHYDLADTMGEAAFSPDSQLVVFRLISSYIHPFIEFVAYEVVSGKRRWCIRRESKDGLGECFTFTPDGHHLLICGRDNHLYLYHADDGTLQARFSSGSPALVEDVAFDHDGKTLWLATKDGLLRHQLQG